MREKAPSISADACYTRTTSCLSYWNRVVCVPPFFTFPPSAVRIKECSTSVLDRDTPEYRVYNNTSSGLHSSSKSPATKNKSWGALTAIQRRPQSTVLESSDQRKRIGRNCRFGAHPTNKTDHAVNRYQISSSGAAASSAFSVGATQGWTALTGPS